MIIFFEIPIIAVILGILCASAGLMAIVGNIAYILFIIAQIALLVMGIVVLVRTVSCGCQTKRFYLVIPGLLFFIFSVLGLFGFYTFFCMSESHMRTINIGIGTVMGQRPRVYVLALILTLIIALAFMKIVSAAFDASVRTSVGLCLLSIILLVAPLFLAGSIAGRQYYNRHNSVSMGAYSLNQDVTQIWKEVNFSENRFPHYIVSYSRFPFPCRISAGTTVYLTGESSRIKGQDCVEVYLNDKAVIGYIPAYFLDGYTDESENRTPAGKTQTLTVTVNKEAPAAGDTVCVSASVVMDGKPITDLEAAGLRLWWWTDIWDEGHGDGLLDAVYSNYDNNSGLSLSADVTLPSTGMYYICAELKDPNDTLIEKVFIPIEAGASENTGEYIMLLAADQAQPAAGDTVSITATVMKDGKEITDLEAAGLRLWWWTDVWAEGHSNGLLDAVYSSYDNNSGLSLSADVTLPGSGTYYICAELKDLNDTLYQKSFVVLSTDR